VADSMFFQQGFSYYGTGSFVCKIPVTNVHVKDIKKHMILFPAADPEKAFVVEDVFEREDHYEFAGKELKGITAYRLVYPVERFPLRIYAIETTAEGFIQTTIEDKEEIQTILSGNGKIFNYYDTAGQAPNAQDAQAADILPIATVVYFINLCEEGNDFARGFYDNEPLLDGFKLSNIRYQNFGYRRMEASAETIVKTLLCENLTSSPFKERNLPNVVVAEDQGRGKVVKFSGRYEPLNEALERVLEEAEMGLHARIDFQQRKIVFDVFFGNTLPNTGTGITFSKEMGNVRAFEVSHLAQGTYNTAVVGGAGEDENRLFYTLDEGATGFARREVFVDGNDEDINMLQLKGKNYLQANKEKIAIEAEITASGGMLPFEDYNIGDECYVVTKDFIKPTRILEMVDTLQPNSERKIDVVFSDSFPNPKQTLTAHVQPQVR
ncbi:MAG: hypothetical protein GX786_05960, partial [Clostridiales bacterium]|nr:hypothetical protein [Clostridiales bacterium]